MQKHSTAFPPVTMGDFSNAIFGTVDIGQAVTYIAHTNDELGIVAVSARIELVLGARLIHLRYNGSCQCRQKAAFLQNHTVSSVKRAQQRQKNVL